MKTITKILIAFFIITAIVGGVLSPQVFSGIKISTDGILINFSTMGIVGLVFMIINMIFGTILFVFFLRSISLSKTLFFSTVPLTIFFVFGIYFVANVNAFKNPLLTNVRKILLIETDSRNNILWAILLTLIYLIIMFFTFSYVCRPLRRIEKTANRLSDGRINGEISVSGGKQFKQIGFALNKINNNYKEKDKKIKKINIKKENSFPKEFIKFMGTDKIEQLEAGENVKKEATLMLCTIKNLNKLNDASSLDYSFNSINSYYNVITPLVKRFAGFVDKFVGDGVLVVFPNPDAAIECSQFLIKEFNLKNALEKNLPNLELRIAISSEDTLFGVLSEADKKTPTIISDALKVMTRFETILSTFDVKVGFSKSTLTDMNSKTRIKYRHIGNFGLTEERELGVFELLDVYPKEKREGLLKSKNKFEEGVRAYSIGQFLSARKIFESTLKDYREDKASYAYFNKSVDKAYESNS